MSETYQPPFGRDDVEVLSRTEKYKGFFQLDKLALKHRLYAGGWSKPVERELFVRGKAACVLLYDPDRKTVVLIEQFRIGALEQASPWCLELVAGIADKDESLEDLVRREAIEEADCEILGQLIPIYTYLVSPGGTNEEVSLFCGKVDSSRVGDVCGLEEEGEDIKVRVTSLQEIPKLMARGCLNNAATLISLQWLLLNKETLVFGV